MTFKPRQAWCGLPLNDPRVAPIDGITYMGGWDKPHGPFGFCTVECRKIGRRFGWHLKLSPRTEQISLESTTLATDDLNKERAKAKNEIRRLKRKVNRLRSTLLYSRSTIDLTSQQLNEMVGKRN